MKKFYRQAEGRPERLPWHQDAPPEILKKAVAARDARGRALDVGCGAGVFSVWLAEQGMEVTGIDVMPEAIAMAQARANERRAHATFILGDVLTFTPDRPFDLVFDSGCLHALVGGSVDAYRRQLLAWLGADADYVLLHWGKRHAFDWRPIGPRRRSEGTIERTFAPDLKLLETEVTEIAAPVPFGNVRGVGYWFRRT